MSKVSLSGQCRTVFTPRNADAIAKELEGAGWRAELRDESHGKFCYGGWVSERASVASWQGGICMRAGIEMATGALIRI